MANYYIHGLCIACDLPLEAALPLPEGWAGEPDVRICAGEVEPALFSETPQEKAGKKSFYYRYEKTRGWVRATGSGVFVMQNGNQVVYRLLPGCNPLLAAEVLLCLCIPVLLIQRGEVLFHGSGLYYGGGALIVSGESGAGKSTLTGQLLRMGGIFMADDTTRVTAEQGKIYAWPGFPQQKLCTDALAGQSTQNMVLLPQETGEEKYALRLKEGFRREKARLKTLVFLSVCEQGGPRVRKALGAEKLKVLLNSLYKKKAYGLMGLEKQAMLGLVQIAQGIEVILLERPKTGLSIKEEARMLLELIYAESDS